MDLNHPNALKLRIIETFEQGRFAEGRAQLSAYKARFGDDPALCMIEAACLLAEGNLPAARTVLEAALADRPDRFDARFTLAAVYLQEGNPQAAAAAYLRARDVAPLERQPDVDAALARLEPTNDGQGLPRRPRLVLIAAQETGTALDDLGRALHAQYEVRKAVVTDPALVEKAMDWADVAWFEGCDALLEHGSRLKAARSTVVVCRLSHLNGLEASLRNVQWKHVDRVVFTEEPLRARFKQIWPEVDRQLAVEVIPHGVALDRLPLRERTAPGFHLAFTEDVAWEANPALLLQILHHLVQIDPRYRLSVAGTIRDERLRAYWDHQIHALGLRPHVAFADTPADWSAWLADKDVLLATSTPQGFRPATAAAMALGIRPVIYNTPHAAESWGQDVLFDTATEAVRQIGAGPYYGRAYRAFIAARYGADLQARRISGLLDELLARQGDWRTRPERIARYEVRDGYYRLPGEASAFFMNPRHFFPYYKDSCPPDVVLQQTQNEFKAIVELYVNGAKPEAFAAPLAYLFELLTSEAYARIAFFRDIVEEIGDPRNVTIEGVEFLLLTLYPVLAELMARVGGDAQTVTLGDTLEEKRFGPEDAAVQTLYTRLHEALAPIEPYLHTFMMHGSLSTLDHTPYSDADTLIVLNERTFETPEALRACRKAISEAAVHLFAFDPIQHHRFFVATEADLLHYPEKYLPLEVFRNATRVLGARTLAFQVRSSEIEVLNALWNMSYGFRQAYVEQAYPQDLFALKRYTSRLMLLPTLYLEAVKNHFPYKRDAFEAARPAFSAEAWQSIETATRLRNAWSPTRMTTLGPKFYEQAYLLAEECLAHLFTLLADLETAHADEARS